MAIAREGALVLPALLAIAAGWTDYRSRRIPNWLTIPGLFVGIAANSYFRGWPGAKASLLGAGLAPRDLSCNLRRPAVPLKAGQRSPGTRIASAHLSLIHI